MIRGCGVTVVICTSAEPHLYAHVLLQHDDGPAVVGRLRLQLPLGGGHHCREGDTSRQSAAVARRDGGLHVTRPGNSQGKEMLPRKPSHTKQRYSLVNPI